MIRNSKIRAKLDEFENKSEKEDDPQMIIQNTLNQLENIINEKQIEVKKIEDEINNLNQ